MKYLTYNREQAYLVPPSVREVLGEDHVCFFLHRAVERLDRSGFETGYMEEGRAAYHPALLLQVWLYAYVLGVGGSRRLEQRIQEDLAFRYLAAGAAPDHWTRNDFRRRHARALNDVFTQGVEIARSLGLGRLGRLIRRGSERTPPPTGWRRARNCEPNAPRFAGRSVAGSNSAMRRTRTRRRASKSRPRK